MDDADLAQARIEREREQAVAAVQALSAGEGQDDCITCADPIEEARRKAVPSARRCITCQEAAERRSRMTRVGVTA
jgi:phage/conjugal plasmid C-4 type zinc finger TraR family protein